MKKLQKYKRNVLLLLFVKEDKEAAGKLCIDNIKIMTNDLLEPQQWKLKKNWKF